MKILSAVFSLFFVFGSNLKAAEADHYTIGDAQVADVTSQVNAMANDGLQQKLDELNGSGTCDSSQQSEERLYEALTDIFSNHKKGQLINAVRDGRIERTVIPLDQSIYHEWSIFNGFLLGRNGAGKSPLALFPLIKVGDVVIGGDKLEHMFGMGLRYFKKHYLEGKALVPVLKGGIFSEKTFLGGNMLATGIFSYADLAANFNGMRFWNHMLQKRDDVLGKQYNVGPYVLCKEGKWTRNQEKPIDFTNYVDETMQESTNCSKFATRGGLEKFKQALAELQTKTPERAFSCPTSQDTLDRVAKKYEVEIQGDSRGSTAGHWIINRDGNEKVSYFNEF
ncbi:MAG: hypothetical protein COT17_04235 [Elusimicrobia bacterium CG08_land_8_20_14_0_20_51_18]|nr:MAG: hypothetical protein COT17_04235 [Elusimicrobia bacterium CG08_land_8_20_14_0_20_51_18]